MNKPHHCKGTGVGVPCTLVNPIRRNAHRLTMTKADKMEIDAAVNAFWAKRPHLHNPKVSNPFV